MFAKALLADFTISELEQSRVKHWPHSSFADPKSKNEERTVWQGFVRSREEQEAIDHTSKESVKPRSAAHFVTERPGHTLAHHLGQKKG
jgi:hypothetical protein